MSAVIYIVPGDEDLFHKAITAYTKLKTCTYDERYRLLEYDDVIKEQEFGGV